jgi:hypothetical protein
VLKASPEIVGDGVVAELEGHGDQIREYAGRARFGQVAQGEVQMSNARAGTSDARNHITRGYVCASLHAHAPMLQMQVAGMLVARMA